ncbi:hypothetical protein ACFVUW_11380 [Streptomyces xiamenensis]|uniref:hypothetical protein n=1 Tax=Streptomyces xiamenensis TaxID=408015 RepID=UPI0036E86F80
MNGSSWLHVPLIAVAMLVPWRAATRALFPAPGPQDVRQEDRQRSERRRLLGFAVMLLVVLGISTGNLLVMTVSSTSWALLWLAITTPVGYAIGRRISSWVAHSAVCNNGVKPAR